MKIRRCRLAPRKLAAPLRTADLAAASLVAAMLSACTPPVPQDTPLAHLNADLAAMRAFPSVKVTTGCAAALRELASARQAIIDRQQQGKAADPVSLDVLQSDQDEAEVACHPDAVRLCQAPTGPAATKACSLIVR